MNNIIPTSKSDESANLVLVCSNCGKGIIKSTAVTQLCSCRTILVLNNNIQPFIETITGCKICLLLAEAEGRTDVNGNRPKKYHYNELIT